MVGTTSSRLSLPWSAGPAVMTFPGPSCHWQSCPSRALPHLFPLFQGLPVALGSAALEAPLCLCVLRSTQPGWRGCWFQTAEMSTQPQTGRPSCRGSCCQCHFCCLGFWLPHARGTVLKCGGINIAQGHLNRNWEPSLLLTL